MNIHWYGQQRLPDTRSNPVAFQRPDFSQPFTLVNAQFTYNFKIIELYGGCENIFDFRQRQPIISWQNPFSPFFDTSSVWGPTRGRELYVGVRFKIEQ
jgi:outer membrane receptor protein involved in Fe transport